MRYATPEEMLELGDEICPHELMAIMLACHVTGARILRLTPDEREQGADSGVLLPDGLGFLLCRVEEHPMAATDACVVQLHVRIALASTAGEPLTIGFSGIGPDLRNAVAVPAGEWGHTFLPALMAGAGRADLCGSEETTYEEFELTVAGRPAVVYAAALDQRLGAEIDEPAPDYIAVRTAPGGRSALTRTGLAELSHLPGPLVMYSFAGHMWQPSVEVRSTIGACPEAEAALARRFPPREDKRIFFYRELAVVVPKN